MTLIVQLRTWLRDSYDKLKSQDLMARIKYLTLQNILEKLESKI